MSYCFTILQALKTCRYDFASFKCGPNYIDPMSEICIFAGTREGRKLIEQLSGRGLKITVRVATEYGEVLL